MQSMHALQQCSCEPTAQTIHKLNRLIIYATEIKLPSLGEGIESGDVLEILVNVGDVIKKDNRLSKWKPTRRPFRFRVRCRQDRERRGQGRANGAYWRCHCDDRDVGVVAPTPPAAQPLRNRRQQPPRLHLLQPKMWLLVVDGCDNSCADKKLRGACNIPSSTDQGIDTDCRSARARYIDAGRDPIRSVATSTPFADEVFQPGRPSAALHAKSCGFGGSGGNRGGRAHHAR